jgi:hypothetical protein
VTNDLIPYGGSKLPDTTPQPGMPVSAEALEYIAVQFVYPIMQTFTGGSSISEEEMQGLAAIWVDAVVGFDPRAYPMAVRMLARERKSPFRMVPAEAVEYLERAEAKIQGRPWRSLFGRDENLCTIAFNRITGVHGNMILDAVPEASRDDVLVALVEISASFKSKWSPSRWDDGESSNAKDLPIKAVIDKTIDQVRKIALYRIYGTPEQQAGGANTRRLKSTWCVIADARLSEWMAEFPKALRDGNDQYRVESRFHEICLNAHDRYGRGLQGEVESALREWMAKAHQQHLAEEEERRREYAKAKADQERLEREKCERQEAYERDAEKRRHLRELDEAARNAAMARPDVAAAREEFQREYAVRANCERTNETHSAFAAVYRPAYEEELAKRGLTEAQVRGVF